MMSFTVLLDDATLARERLVGFERPSRVIAAWQAGEVPAALAAIEMARAAGKWVAGYFAYELGYALEQKLHALMPPKTEGPLLWFGVFDDAVSFEGAAVSQLLETLPRGRAYAGPLTHEWSREDYRARFARVRALIEAGDIYQANLTFRSRFAFTGDPLALYRDLRARSQASCGGYVDDGTRKILSLSPELFFEISPDGLIAARPMKGTAARGADEIADSAARAALAASEKDRAENLMIVDLIRNDLGRIAEMGSVDVGKLFAVETYPTLHQLVSTVTARLRSPTSVADIVRALFPCGSITGAPKIRAMQVIRELEESPRGVYCGAIGCFAPDGSARFNVAIRTITIEQDRGELGIGGGLVYDSDADAEYDECLLKAAYFEAARKPIGLIETMRYAPGSGIARRDLHLARLERSANSLGIGFDRTRVERVLDKGVAGAPSDLRVRLVLSDGGSVEATMAELPPHAAQLWRYAISPVALSVRDAFARHKTTWRRHLDGEHARLSRLTGCDEVLFLNEDGDVVEGSRTNVFLQRGDVLVTPPLSSGCLDGCLRRELIESGRAIEGRISARALGSGEVLLGNSLRGLIPATLIEDVATAAR
jgi:para-aminobenzoate synthetase/4-amino-4-deoxychorismate lyase